MPVAVGDGHDHVEFKPVGFGPPVPVPMHSLQTVVEVVQDEVAVLFWLWHLWQTLLVDEFELEVQGSVLVTVPIEVIVLVSVTVHVVVSVVVEPTPETEMVETGPVTETVEAFPETVTA